MSSIHFLKPASAFGLAALLAFGGIPATALATAQKARADRQREYRRGEQLGQGHLGGQPLY